jgi:hypothetical protein
MLWVDAPMHIDLLRSAMHITARKTAKLLSAHKGPKGSKLVGLWRL